MQQCCAGSGRPECPLSCRVVPVGWHVSASGADKGLLCEFCGGQTAVAHMTFVGKAGTVDGQLNSPL